MIASELAIDRAGVAHEERRGLKHCSKGKKMKKWLKKWCRGKVEGNENHLRTLAAGAEKAPIRDAAPAPHKRGVRGVHEAQFLNWECTNIWFLNFRTDVASVLKPASLSRVPKALTACGQSNHVGIRGFVVASGQALWFCGLHFWKSHRMLNSATLFSQNQNRNNDPRTRIDAHGSVLEQRSHSQSSGGQRRARASNLLHNINVPYCSLSW